MCCASIRFIHTKKNFPEKFPFQIAVTLFLEVHFPVNSHSHQSKTECPFSPHQSSSDLTFGIYAGTTKRIGWKTMAWQSKLMKPQMGNCCYPQPTGSINEQFCPHPLPGKKMSPCSKLVSSVLVWRECHFGNPLQHWAFSEHTPQPRDQLSQMEGCHLLRRSEGNLPT